MRPAMPPAAATATHSARFLRPNSQEPLPTFQMSHTRLDRLFATEPVEPPEVADADLSIHGSTGRLFLASSIPHPVSHGASRRVI